MQHFRSPLFYLFLFLSAFHSDSLSILSHDGRDDRHSPDTLSVLASKVFNEMLSYEPVIVDLKSATYLYQLISSLHLISSNETHRQQTKQMREFYCNTHPYPGLYPPSLRSVCCVSVPSITGTLCRGLLCRRWFNYSGHLEKGAQCNIYLDELVRGFLRDSDFKRQSDILTVIRVECEALKKKDGALKSFPNIKK